MATLYIVATPIGNLGDISDRAKETLATVSMILCEDTRVTGKLLSRYGLQTPMMTYHQHSSHTITKRVLDLLEDNKDLALVTDAGTPGINDPGGKLVEAVAGHCKITPIPGACALIAALCVAGVPADEFVYLGFPPNKKGRASFFDRLCAITSTGIIYESTHRILKTLEEIHMRVPSRHLIVCRELTKLHETIYRGTAAEVTAALNSTSIKGEFVIVLAPL
jgi:16S rRNA (cytidine1402-2'-O)-methyltransferase